MVRDPPSVDQGGQEMTENLPDYMGDRKRWLETQAEIDERTRTFEGSNIETTCPGCGWDVWAHVVDGPDPVFINLVCPRDNCNHEFTERVG